MRGYRITLTCPYDGHELEHQADGVTNGWEARALARCPECKAQLLIAMTVRCTNEMARRKPGAEARPTTRAAKAAAIPVTQEEGDEIAAAVLTLCQRIAEKSAA